MSPAPVSRRTFLASCAASVLPLAGCTALPFVENPIDMTILNHHTESRQLSVTALRANEREYSEAVAFSRSYEVPADTDSSTGVIKEKNILSSAVYIVQVDLEAGFADQSFHFHFYPDCTGGTDADGRKRPEDEFLIQIQRNGTNVVFAENGCSTDSWKL